MSSASKVDSSYEDIVKAVLSEVTHQLKTTISENVKASVESMAQSVADIITTTLNDRITMIETDNRQLWDQIQQLSARVTELEAQKMNTTKNLDKAEQYSRSSCLRISGVAETPEEVTDDIVISIASECGVDLSNK